MKMKNTRNRAKLKEKNRKLVRTKRIGEGGVAWEQTRAVANDRRRMVEKHKVEKDSKRRHKTQ
jgi:hypothetical protein